MVTIYLDGRQPMTENTKISRGSMCVVSMIMDHGRDWPWRPPLQTINPPRQYPNPNQLGGNYDPISDAARQAENDRLAKLLSELLRKAAEYDKLNKEPHCESSEKKAKLQALADELGVKIEFPDETPEHLEGV